MSSWLYQPFAPKVSGGITGATTFTFSTVGALKGTGNLTGTSSVVFSTSGTLIGLKKSLVRRPRSAVLMPLLHF